MSRLLKEQLSERPSRANYAIPMARPSVGTEELEAVGQVFEGHWLGSGPLADEFSARIADVVGAEYVIAVNSGTAALHAAMVALQLEPGDEVIVPSMTFVSTIQAITAVGATPVFCEVLADTMNMDVEDAARRVTPQTRALLPVHYGGAACDLSAVLDLAASQELRTVEDAAHAFGSSYHGRPIGSHGDVVCFSFDPIKNITCGLGGAAATNDDELAKRLRTATNVGIDPSTIERGETGPLPYAVTSAGLRYRMSDVNAAIGLTQLDKMDTFKSRKLEIVRRYDASFADISELSLLHRDLAGTFPFSYGLRVIDGSRDRLMDYLANQSIGTAVQFIPNHLQPFFDAHRTELPRTEQLFDEVVSIPLYSGLTDEEVDTVVSAVRSFFGKP
jgi:perosamine synthetase